VGVAPLIATELTDWECVLGEAKRRNTERRCAPIGRRIYCGAKDGLSDEHAVPYGLGGILVLPEASCHACAGITSSIELRLLRRAWWPYRRALGLTTRRPNEQPDDFPVTLKSKFGAPIKARLRASDHPMIILFLFPPPAVLSGQQNIEATSAGKVVIRRVAPMPTSVIVDGSNRPLRPGEDIEYPIDMDASDFVRFLAKVGLGYAIFERGLAAFSELFLPSVVLGSGKGALTFVGNPSGSIQPPVIREPPLHGLMLRREGSFCNVYVQLFKGKNDPPPIYQVVVGKFSE
jgi:hypothetical protein